VPREGVFDLGDESRCLVWPHRHHFLAIHVVVVCFRWPAV
jgi:hypothetical protein